MSGRKPAAATPSAVKCEIGQNDKLDLDNVVESFQQRRFAKSAANFVSSAKKAGCLHVVFRIPPKMLATQFDGLKVQRCKVRIEEEKMPLGAGTLEGFKTTLVNEDIIPFKRFCKMWNEANLRPLGNSKAKASAHDKYPDVDKAGKWFFGKPIEQAEFSCDEAVRRYVPSLTTKYARYEPTHEQGGPLTIWTIPQGRGHQYNKFLLGQHLVDPSRMPQAGCHLVALKFGDMCVIDKGTRYCIFNSSHETTWLTSLVLDPELRVDSKSLVRPAQVQWQRRCWRCGAVRTVNKSILQSVNFTCGDLGGDVQCILAPDDVPGDQSTPLEDGIVSNGLVVPLEFDNLDDSGSAEGGLRDKSNDSPLNKTVSKQFLTNTGTDVARKCVKEAASSREISGTKRQRVEHESNTVRDRTALDENYMVEFYGRYGIPAEKLKSCLKVLAFMKDEIDSDDRQHVHRRKAIVRFLDLCHDSSHSHSVARFNRADTADKDVEEVYLDEEDNGDGSGHSNEQEEPHEIKRSRKPTDQRAARNKHVEPRRLDRATENSEYVQSRSRRQKLVSKQSPRRDNRERRDRSRRPSPSNHRDGKCSDHTSEDDHSEDYSETSATESNDDDDSSGPSDSQSQERERNFNPRRGQEQYRRERDTYFRSNTARAARPDHNRDVDESRHGRRHPHPQGTTDNNKTGIRSSNSNRDRGEFARDVQQKPMENMRNCEASGRRLSAPGSADFYSHHQYPLPYRTPQSGYLRPVLYGPNLVPVSFMKPAAAPFSKNLQNFNQQTWQDWQSMPSQLNAPPASGAERPYPHQRQDSNALASGHEDFKKKTG